MSKSYPKRILTALSGGVDSSVSAALLKKEGHEIEGVYVRTWEHEDDLLADCPGARDLADAEAVADTLGIPFRVVNFIDFYHREVVLPMVKGYEDGITPNPDILCNRSMKFGALLEYARKNGFDGLATGHYCIRKETDGASPELWEGRDKNKDQSYFLARITPEQLSGARFPLGEVEKPRVREIARELDLPVADKKDSQGICFLGKVNVPEFLSNFIEDKPGEIVTTKGKVVGHHQGLHRYTLGQRRGIGVPSKYRTLPVCPSVSVSAVTLKRASREMPQATKKISPMASHKPRIPSENARTAGATPKLTMSARLSRSAP